MAKNDVDSQEEVKSGGKWKLSNGQMRNSIR